MPNKFEKAHLAALEYGNLNRLVEISFVYEGELFLMTWSKNKWTEPRKLKVLQ